MLKHPLMRRFLSFITVGIFCLGLALAHAVAANAQGYDQSLYSGLRWRLIGPFRGGRVLAVSGITGDPTTFYFGAVGGGVWKTTNGGRTWLPLFDAEPVASIGALAVAPSDPNVIYVGSGEADMRSDIQAGNGMYKSIDGGKTWAHIGLADSRQIGKIIVDPKDADTLYVAALGHQYGPNAERGVFKSTDGGSTWSKILYKDENTGAIDLSLDAHHSNVLYASLWQTRRPPWNVYPPSNGAGSGLYKTVDGGKTWSKVSGNGFPAVVGHVGIAISPADSSRVYALVDTDDTKNGGMYRSDDSGQTWRRTDGEGRIWTRGWYFGGVTADPKNRDEVYVNDTSTYRSTDGGKSFDAIKGAPGGDDNHSLWIDPTQTNRMILGTDQGAIISNDGAKTWSSWYNQPTGQFYHVALDTRFPYWAYGAQQDSGGMAVPSRSSHAGIGNRDWKPIDAPGESGYAAPDPLHPGMVFGGTVTVENVNTGAERNLDPTLKYARGVIWRNTWTLPLVFSEADPHVLYFSHQRIFRTANGGRTWSIISPDLTRPANLVPTTLDAATIADSTGLARRGVVYTIAPSPVDAQRIWAGTDDGLIWLTRDGGTHWQNVGPSALRPWSKVGIIDASHFDADTAYAAVDRHRLDDTHPYIYRTHDAGKHWTAIVRGIPSTSFVNVVREDPARKGLLYAGTDSGAFVSFDDGNRWESLQLNLPTASIRDIAFRNGDLAIATHGRAFWILDDLTPLRQLDARVASARDFLFKPAIAYRIRPGSDEGTPLPLDEPAAKNPPDGAIIDYYLRSSTPVALRVTDHSGRVVRRWTSSDKPVVINPKSVNVPAYWLHPVLPPSATAGEHRFVWDLRYTNARGPWAPPGIYTVALTADGKTISAPLIVARDPRATANDAALRKQFTLAMRIEADKARIAAVGTEYESIRAKTAKNPALRKQLDLLVRGSAPTNTPDDSVGKPSHDFTSLDFVNGWLSALEDAVESADAAPGADNYTTLARAESALHAALAKYAGLKRQIR